MNNNNIMTRDEYLFWRLVDNNGEPDGGEGLSYSMELDISPLYAANFRVTGLGVNVYFYVYIDDESSPFYKALREQGFDNWTPVAEKMFYWDTFDFDQFMKWIDLHGQYKFAIPEDIRKEREERKAKADDHK